MTTALVTIQQFWEEGLSWDLQSYLISVSAQVWNKKETLDVWPQLRFVLAMQRVGTQITEILSNLILRQFYKSTAITIGDPRPRNLAEVVECYAISLIPGTALVLIVLAIGGRGQCSGIWITQSQIRKEKWPVNVFFCFILPTLSWLLVFYLHRPRNDNA